jgi:tRNA G18 (ribose-2'-O)-methylase SpoU
MLKHNIETFAATPHSKNILQNLDMPNKFVVLIGNESRGLSQYALEHSDQNFKIEMPGCAQSLNAAIAGAIIMYEISKSLFKS